ncbi:SAM-dependent methyltransferase [Rhizomonospora bruguierae]|uniref:SAM-dependent methyltransferase n=1 Tax=Rhizomonospora bruguierae TaxID=1581705 RepID=UPI001BCFC91C|nr:class I SAM-dependent methyltransferase [Micromonospora sp. NBRC 107566]
MTETLDPRFADYLTTNRDFVDAAIAEAVAALDLPTGGQVLDMGTGAGGAIPHLARAVGRTGRVLAVDLNPAVTALAADHADRAGVTDRVTIRTGDATELLTEAAYDAIWTSDVIWPGNFDDPAAVVAAMARAVKPRGVVALFYSNYYQASFLPGQSRLERLLRTASELRWQLPADGPQHYERHLAWLLGAGLHDVRLRSYPRIGFPVDADPTIRPYLESAVWPELRESAARCGEQAGLTAAELSEVKQLLTPGNPRYVVDQPGFFIMHPTILATGHPPVPS